MHAALQVGALTEAMDKLPATSAETTSSSEEMKEACEKVGQLLKDAESANSDAKSLSLVGPSPGDDVRLVSALRLCSESVHTDLLRIIP